MPDLAENRDKRANVPAALRENYDGKSTRGAGTDGGHNLCWQGKAGRARAAQAAVDAPGRSIFLAVEVEASRKLIELAIR